MTQGLPRNDSPEWLDRARGWLRVMRLDVWVSLIVYTVATLAFYFLGAATLGFGMSSVECAVQFVKALQNRPLYVTFPQEQEPAEEIILPEEVRL